MNQRRTASETRQLVFEACGRILRGDGLTNLTLEKVAQEAGLSKGGLLYHFPNKESLIEALFEYHNNIFETRLQALAEKEGDDTGAWLRAYAKASIEQITDAGNASLYASLFAAEERYASAHASMRRKYIDWQQQVENSGLDPTWATLVRLAVDRLWFAEMHQYAPPDAERRTQIVDLILQLTYDSLPIHS
jgi:AcrR family transcriptional regulator